MPLRIQLLLGQMPQDPASGAPRSMRTICEFLAASGMEVAALATTAGEGGGNADPLEILRRSDPSLTVERQADPSGSQPVWRFKSRGVKYTLLDTCDLPFDGWEARFGGQFDRLLELQLQSFRPDILFTYGGQPAEMARRKRAREFGCAVVFGLRNLGYLHEAAFEDVDDILTGSQFVSDRYRKVLGIQSTPLPLPLDLADVIAPPQERVFVTYINPSIEKGVMFVATLFEQLSVRRPDIPLLVVESRGTAGMLVAAGLRGGFDLRRHENLMCSPPVARPAEFLAMSRVVLMPSVWEEPAGRVAAEAVINGIPAIVSDRGGLAEVSNGGAFVLPLPDDLTPQTRTPVPPQAVEPWVELLQRLMDDESFYAAAAARALEAGKCYRPEVLMPRYAEFFRSVRRKER